MTARDLYIGRIVVLEQEQGKLKLSHDLMVAEFQRKVTENQTRFAQIDGAIKELKELIEHESESQTHTERIGNHIGTLGNDMARRWPHLSGSGNPAAGSG